MLEIDDRFFSYNSRCPYAPDYEPKKVCRCAGCNRWIFEGETVFEVDFNNDFYHFCADCVHETTADIEEG